MAITCTCTEHELCDPHRTNRDRISRLYRTFPVYCSWCGAQTGHARIEHSHGICPPCKTKWNTDMDATA